MNTGVSFVLMGCLLFASGTCEWNYNSSILKCVLYLLSVNIKNPSVPERFFFFFFHFSSPISTSFFFFFFFAGDRFRWLLYTIFPHNHFLFLKALNFPSSICSFYLSACSIRTLVHSYKLCHNSLKLLFLCNNFNLTTEATVCRIH